MSTPLDPIADRRREGGFSAKELLRNDREWAVCFTCRKRHPLRGNNADHDYQDFACRHPADQGHLVMRIGPAQMDQMVRRAERRKAARHDSILGFTENASVLEAFQSSSQSVDLTGLNSLATSVTAGWCSAWVDNSTNLYLDYLYYVNMAAVATTAPSSQKAHFAYATGSHASGDLPNNTAGNTVTNSASVSAALTYLDITANPTGFNLVRVIPFLTTNKPINSGIFAVAPAFGGWIPLFHWLGYVNAAGPTIAASGNAIKYRGVYSTVA